MHVSADRLIGALRADGLRITAARRAVCAVIAEAHDEHLTATDILNRARADGASLDQSTVYRTVEALEGSGLLTHTHLGHGASVYHLADEAEHQHFVCDRCGAAAAIAAGDLAGFIRDIEAKSGFVVDPGHFALSGLCADCARLIS